MAKSARGQRLLIGLALLIMGGLFLLENLADWEVPWRRWWPVIIIVLGIWNLAQKTWMGGAVITALGVFFLFNTLDVWDYSIGDIWRFWPVILILVGAKLLFGRRKTRRGGPDVQSVTDESVPGEMHVTSVFGSSDRRVTDRDVSRGQIFSVFGSTKINLLDAALADGEATLDLTVIFGSATIRVPDKWNVDIQTTNLMGSVEDKRSKPPIDASGDRLTMTGICLLGGIEVES